MITPRRGGDVNGLRVGIKATKESTADAQGTCSGDSLRNSDLTTRVRQQAYRDRIRHTELACSGALSAP